MNRITQSEQGLKHISLLRRIFLQKLTGTLRLNFSTGDKDALQFRNGVFLGSKDTVLPVLQRILTEYIPEYEWKPYTLESVASCGVLPWTALSEVLRDLPINNQRLVLYQRVFSNLPPMVLKNCPVQRMGFADSEAYLALYYLGLGVPSFSVKIFFLGNLSKDDLTRHVRTVLLVFLLGYLRPAPKKEENKNINIVSRIFNRFKAKGGVQYG